MRIRVYVCVNKLFPYGSNEYFTHEEFYVALWYLKPKVQNLSDKRQSFDPVLHLPSHTFFSFWFMCSFIPLSFALSVFFFLSSCLVSFVFYTLSTSFLPFFFQFLASVAHTSLPLFPSLISFLQFIAFFLSVIASLLSLLFTSYPSCLLSFYPSRLSLLLSTFSSSVLYCFLPSFKLLSLCNLPRSVMTDRFTTNEASRGDQDKEYR